MVCIEIILLLLPKYWLMFMYFFIGEATNIPILIFEVH
jgi:hypothetical protein